MSDNYLVIRGLDNAGHAVIYCEVSGAREARQLLETYVTRYPGLTFTMRGN